MNSASNDYGLWGLVVVNSAIFIGFAYSFFKPVNLRDWRSPRPGTSCITPSAVTNWRRQGLTGMSAIRSTSASLPSCSAFCCSGPPS